MASAFEDIDYKNKIFEYPDVTNIVGKPTTASLITLHNEIKANTQSMHTTLGGGENGHLGLGWLDIICTTHVPGTPYECPVNPGPFIINGDETQYQIAQCREEHREAHRLLKY